jgi:hypothetical protein
VSATLGPVGDTLYWGAVGVLGLIGIALPICGRYERVTLLAGDGALRIRTVLSFIRSRRSPRTSRKWTGPRWGVSTARARVVTARWNRGATADLKNSEKYPAAPVLRAGN